MLHSTARKTSKNTTALVALSFNVVVQLWIATGVSAEAYHVRTRQDKLALLRELAEIGPERHLSAEGKPNPYKPVPQGRVFGGQDFPGSVPGAPTYLPELVLLDATEGCHGVLFNTDIVVTTVYCADKLGERHEDVHVGIINKDDYTPTAGETVAIHPCHRPDRPKLEFDVALVKLDSPVSGDAYTSSTINQNPKAPEYNGEDLFFAGYGSNAGAEYPVNLQNSTVQYLRTCGPGEDSTFPRYSVESNICVVKPPNSGPCIHDFGAPLYYCPNAPGDCTIVGLWSHLLLDTGDPNGYVAGLDRGPWRGENSNCNGSRPEIFTRLSSFYDWIYINHCTYSSVPFDCTGVEVPDPKCKRPDPTPPVENSTSCFSEDSIVDVLGKGETKMANLAVGDKIRTLKSYEQVYAFAHLDRITSASYLHFYTKNSKAPLEVTEDHLVRVNGKYIPAKEVKVGDTLTDGSHGEVAVERITISQKTGLYAPLTPSGTLVVNGIQASAYVSLQKDSKGNLILGGMDTHISFHFLNHIALSPIRMACMWISSSFCAVEHMEANSGYPPFVSFWLKLVQWFEQQLLPTQIFLLFPLFCIVGPIFTVETLASGSFGFFLLVSVFLIVFHPYFYKKQSSISKTKQI